MSCGKQKLSVWAAWSRTTCGAARGFSLSVSPGRPAASRAGPVCRVCFSVRRFRSARGASGASGHGGRCFCAYSGGALCGVRPLPPCTGSCEPRLQGSVQPVCCVPRPAARPASILKKALTHLELRSSPCVRSLLTLRKTDFCPLVRGTTGISHPRHPRRACQTPVPPSCQRIWT